MRLQVWFELAIPAGVSGAKALDGRWLHRLTRRQRRRAHQFRTRRRVAPDGQTGRGRLPALLRGRADRRTGRSGDDDHADPRDGGVPGRGQRPLLPARRWVDGRRLAGARSRHASSATTASGTRPANPSCATTVERRREPQFKLGRMATMRHSTAAILASVAERIDIIGPIQTAAASTPRVTRGCRSVRATTAASAPTSPRTSPSIGRSTRR